MITITFIPQGKKVTVTKGTDLLQAASLAGVPVEGSCGGKGTCGKCKVRILNGKGAAPSSAEKKFLSTRELAEGWVLACRYQTTADTTVEVRPQNDAHRRKTGLKSAVPAIKVQPEPAVEKVYLPLPPPTVADQTPDLERLLERLPRKGVRAGLRELAGLPATLRRASFAVTAVLAEDRLVALEPGDTTEALFGLAFDIGTTTLMGSLVDLRRGVVLGAAAATNPQKTYGGDVISRITYAARGADSLARLQRAVREALNGIIAELLEQTGVPAERIYEVVAVGNTTMSHLLLGVDPTNLAPAPFIPAFRRAEPVAAAELGLAVNPGARVLLLPNIAGYVGSDTVGVILATGLDETAETCLAVDIGTNGELVLAAGGRLLTCSTAAGPAFEGAQIRHGMRAADGAIESVHIEEDVVLEVIGNTAPRGICGSGLIDAAAALLQAGVVEPSGRLVDPQREQGAKLPPRLKKRLRRGEKGMEFVLAGREITGNGEEIVLSQEDLRELQLAKGAIHAGFQILLKEAGITPDEVEKVLLAGAFGNYIRKESALAVGLLPPLPPERIIPVGNAAGDGARLALASRSVRERAFTLPERVEHIELSTRADFQEEFLRALPFPRR